MNLKVSVRKAKAKRITTKVVVFDNGVLAPAVAFKEVREKEPATG